MGTGQFTSLHFRPILRIIGEPKLVMDPDGYLLRFAQSLGEKPT